MQWPQAVYIHKCTPSFPEWNNNHMQVAGASFSCSMWKSLARRVAASPSVQPLVAGGTWGPHNTFLGGLQDHMAAHEQLDLHAVPSYGIVCDNVNFHRVVQICE